jgi:hypothetical protein
MMRYYIGFLVTFGLLILLVFLLFHGGGSKANVPTTSAPLYSYASTSAQVRLTIDGPINANQNHQQVQITADQNSVTYDQIQGYDGNVINQQQFTNSENAYSAFLHALEVAGFTEGNSSAALSDEQGQCPLGDRFTFELIQNGNDLERFWTTSCPKSPRNYEGDAPLTITLFQAQVPGYGTLTKNLFL